MCDCEMCKLSRRISAEKPKMTPETLKIVTELWNLWEDAATELAMTKHRLAAENRPVSSIGRASDS